MEANDIQTINHKANPLGWVAAEPWAVGGWQCIKTVGQKVWGKNLLFYYGFPQQSIAFQSGGGGGRTLICTMSAPAWLIL